MKDYNMKNVKDQDRKKIIDEEMIIRSEKIVQKSRDTSWKKKFIEYEERTYGKIFGMHGKYAPR